LPEKLLIELRERLRFLNDVGLEYLTLTGWLHLSGGERSGFSSRLLWVASGRDVVCAR